MLQHIPLRARRRRANAMHPLGHETATGTEPSAHNAQSQTWACACRGGKHQCGGHPAMFGGYRHCNLHTLVLVFRLCLHHVDACMLMSAPAWRVSRVGCSGAVRRAPRAGPHHSGAARRAPSRPAPHHTRTKKHRSVRRNHRTHTGGQTHSLLGAPHMSQSSCAGRAASAAEVFPCCLPWPTDAAEWPRRVSDAVQPCKEGTSKVPRTRNTRER